MLVKVEEVVRPTTRARAPEIVGGTLSQKLGVYWAARQVDPGTRRDGLLLKLDELDRSVP